MVFRGCWWYDLPPHLQNGALCFGAAQPSACAMRAALPGAGVASAWQAGNLLLSEDAQVVEMAALPRLGLECQMRMPASCASLLADKRLPTGEQGKVMAALMWLRSGTPPTHPARQCNGPANEQRGGRVEDVAALLRCLPACCAECAYQGP